MPLGSLEFRNDLLEELRKSQGSLVSSVCQEVMAMGSVRTRAGARRTSRHHLGGERA